MTFIACLRRGSRLGDTDYSSELELFGSGAEIMTFGRNRQAAFIFSSKLTICGEVIAPVSLDGCSWLIGSVRLDRKAELLAKLGPSPNGLPNAPSDAQLVLAAFNKWGSEFVERLSGDFSFVLWDDQRQQLIGVRDQIGIRSLFHADLGPQCLISNSLDILARVPEVRDALDEEWIADFLYCGFGLNHQQTVYRAAKRLPPGHLLSVSELGSEQRRYWKLQLDNPLHYANPNDYCDQFHDLLSKSISDRLPAGRVGVLMSGGLDSTTLAAKSVEVTGDPASVVTLTRHFSSLIPDDELQFSSLVAKHLGVRNRTEAMDDRFYDAHWREQGKVAAEPNYLILSRSLEQASLKDMARDADVWFYGEGPDNALTFEWRQYLALLRREQDWGRLAKAGVDYLATKSAGEWGTTLDPIGRFRRSAKAQAMPSPLAWIDPDFAKTSGLIERHRRDEAQQQNAHPWKPRAMASFENPIWASLLEMFDPVVSGAPFDMRHPYLDLRVLQFMLAVPAIPWARRKRLIRVAMRGRLPAEVLSRRKTPLAKSPIDTLMSRLPFPTLSAASPVARYVNPERFATAAVSGADRTKLLLAVVLDDWLTRRGSP